MVKAMGLNNISWEVIIADNVKAKFVELNVKAFKAGMTVDTK